VASTILLQRFYEEVLLWETLSHPNVLKFIGAREDLEERQFIIASEWMMHGSIMNYIQNNSTNRLELVRDFTLPATQFTEIQL